MDAELCDTAMTGHKLDELLRKSKDIHVNGHHLIHVDAKIVGVNQGFTSKVLRVHLKWSSENDGLPKSVIVKIIGSTALHDVFTEMSMEDMDKIQSHIRLAHNIECAVYALDTLRKHVPMPGVFATVQSSANQSGIMVLEDLSDQGIVLPMATVMDTGLGSGQLHSLLEALAGTHAWSVNRDDWKNSIRPLSEFNVFEPFVNSMLSMFPKSKSRYPDVFESLEEDELKTYINGQSYLRIFGCDPKERYNLPLILVHGDVHVMNMMFERNSNDEAGDKIIALLDWQVSHQGCAMEDLSRLMNICISNESTQEEEDQILKRYVELFNSKLDNPENRISYENARKALDIMQAYNGVLWACGIVFFDGFMEKMTFGPEAKKALMNRFLNKHKSKMSSSMKILKAFLD